MRPPIDRASAEDMVSLATDRGAAPMQVGAVLRLGSARDFDVARACLALGERIRAVPRLRQRLVGTPPGCGRPVWVDDPEFRLEDHVGRVACPSPGDEEALLRVAAGVVTSRLPADRALWRALFVTGLGDGGTGLVVAIHHVLADGIGGLAVLGALVDGAGAPPDTDFPRPPPSRRALALDALRGRGAGLARLPAALRRLPAAAAELRPAAVGGRAAPSSLNLRTGPHRRLAAVRADLDALHATARAHGATVNDAVLTAVAGALGRLLRARGEHVHRFVVSVPAATRQQASATDLGNHVGVLPVDLPGTGDPVLRLREVAARTRAAKAAPREASTALLGPVFRMLGRVGLLQRFLDRQRLIHTFATNLRGPDTTLSLAGAPIEEVLPVAVVTGNVPISFAVLSYAGTLAITVIADPDACPDLDVLRDVLQDELDLLALPAPMTSAAP